MSEETADREEQDRRAMPRYPSRAKVRVLRDTDAMRLGLSGQLINVSVSGVGFRINAPLDIGELILIELTNEVQRFKKEVRGVVRHVTVASNGEFLTGVELRLRMTPPEVELLRSHRPADPEDGSGTWV